MQFTLVVTVIKRFCKLNNWHVFTLIIDSILVYVFPCRMGFRGRELLTGVGKAMVQGGGTFGTFMAIGTGIRC